MAADLKLTNDLIAIHHFTNKLDIGFELVKLYKSALNSVTLDSAVKPEIAYLQNLKSLKPDMDKLERALTADKFSFNAKKTKSLTGAHLDKLIHSTDEIKTRSTALARKFLRIIPENEEALIGNVAGTLCAFGDLSEMHRIAPAAPALANG